jgi:hypothetical protein
VLFFQVGGFCEFYAGEDRVVATELGLRPMGRNRRGAAFGFPYSRTDEFLRRLRERQRSVLFIGESPVAHARIRARLPVARYGWSGNSAEQASNQFRSGDFEVGRHVGEDACNSPDPQRIVRRDRHMVLRS